MKPKSKNEYYQSNPIVQARRNYNLIEHQLFRLAIADLNPKLKKSQYYNEQFPTFHLSTAEVIKIFQGENGNSHSIYEKLLISARNMAKSNIEIGNAKAFKIFPVFDTIEFSVKEGLTVIFHRNMKPFLLDFDKGNYTRCYLQLAFELSTKNSLILLELMLQYRGLEKNNVIERKITVEELKFALDIDDNAYQGRMNNFRIKVINPAIEEINKKTNYYINPDYKIERGRWRKIKSFLFTMTLPDADAESQPKIKPKKEDIPLLEISTTTSSATLADKQSSETVMAELPTKKNESQAERQEEPKPKKKITDYTNEELKTLKKLLEIKLNKDTALELVDECGLKAIDKAFKEMNQTRKKGVPIENPAGFIRYKTYEYFNSENEITEEDIFARVAEIEENERQEQIRLKEEADKKESEEKVKHEEEEKARLQIRNQYSEEELLTAKEKIYQDYLDNNKSFTDYINEEIKKYGLRWQEIVTFHLKSQDTPKKEILVNINIEPLNEEFIKKIKADYYQNGKVFSSEAVKALAERGWTVSKFQTKYMLNL